jgi:hypothetical protein
MGSKDFFSKEGELDDRLKNLLLLDDLPGLLKEQIMLAQKEIDENGVISSSTQENIEYYFDYYFDTIIELVEKYRATHNQA